MKTRQRSQHRRLRLREQGAASLLVTVLLCAALLLAILFGHRGLLLESRMSAQQAQSTRAFEAAEAGIEWATAQLNRPGAVDTSCVAVGAVGTSFRDRYLAASTTELRFTPRTWSQGGQPTPLQAACVRSATGWICHCPSDAAATLLQPEGHAIAPAFRVRFESVAAQGVIRLVSIGCTRPAGPCSLGAGAADEPEATARVQVDLALLPALVSAPPTPLSARGSIRSPAALRLVNTDTRSGGMVAHSGGAIDLPLAHIETPAGSSLAHAFADHDAPFAGMTPEALFVSLFGVAKATWRDLPMVQHLSCTGSCTTELLGTIAQATGPAQVWVDGDLTLDGPIELGSTERPVVVVVSGQLQLRGDVQLHGMLHARAAAWSQPATSAAALQGALVTETDYTGDAAGTFVYDARVLDTLRQAAGSFVRVPGSWRDF